MKNARRGSQRLFAVYGANGCGRAVLPVADSMLSAQHEAEGYELVFIDDAQSASTINGRRVLTYGEFLAVETDSRAVAIAIADSQTRQRLAERCCDDGVASFSIMAPNAVIMDEVQIGDGSIVSPFVTLTSNIRIGRYFHANLYSYVEHDCRIGDFVTFAPGVKCNGNIVIEEHAYIGAGAILRQGTPGRPLRIGRGAIVGMGAVVVGDVAAGVTVVGNPARPIEECH